MRTLAALMLAGVLIGAAACSTPQPAPVKVGGVQLVRIENTPEDIRWCVSHPGGSPEWTLDSDGTRILVCRIVP